MDTLRCIHASRLLLDHQLHVAGEFEPAVRKIVEDTALTAFERVIDEALLRKVDCLLVSGDCFDPDDGGLRGPAAFVREIGRLAECDTAVIVHSSAHLWSNWPAGLRWPPHAHRLGIGFETSVSITREGKLLATISADGHGDRHTGWQVRLAEAAGEGRTFHLTDDPGPLQGLRADETGPHGCSLIEIDPAAGPRQTRVPVAPVRWEHCAAAVATDSTRDDLLQELASQLEQFPRYTGEEVRLVTWTVSGHGQLWERLAQPGFQNDFLDELTLLNPLSGVTIQTHALKLHAAPGSHWPHAPTEDLGADFVVRLDERFTRPDSAWRDYLADSELHGGPWEVKFETLSGELDAGELAYDARRLAMHWFAAQEELSS